MISVITRLCTALILIGVAAMCQPWWSGGFRGGFFAVLSATVGLTIFARFDAPKSR